MSEQDPIISRLEDLDKRFDEIAERMRDPSVASDVNQFTELSREYARLEKIVAPFRDYKSALAEREGAEAIADDPSTDEELRNLAKAEIEELTERSEKILEEIKSRLVMSEDEDINSIMLEIRAGTGGEEAALFAADILNMYRRYAETRGWRMEILSASGTDVGGFREVIANIRGQDVWSRMGYEGGGHRVQRVPQTESQGRIHTSAVTVAVLPEPKDLQVEVDWDNDVDEQTRHASGPGGQNVNKVESAIRLEHLPTGITVSMSDEKSQHKNRTKARRILAARVAEHYRLQQQAEEAAARKAMIGSGDRSQRVRTYNFPQNRCTDHRLKDAEGAKNFNLQDILSGNMDPLIDALIAQDRSQRLASIEI